MYTLVLLFLGGANNFIKICVSFNGSLFELNDIRNFSLWLTLFLSEIGHNYNIIIVKKCGHNETIKKLEKIRSTVTKKVWDNLCPYK